MKLSPEELQRVEALTAAGATPAAASAGPPEAPPTSFASLVATRRRRLDARRD